MAQPIIIKPLLTEKSTKVASDPELNQYTFVVAEDANKIQIRKAAEEQFGVEVVSVKTMICPGKKRSRIVKGRMTSGRKSPYKKAIITVREGQYIEEGFYGESMEEDFEDADIEETEEEINA